MHTESGTARRNHRTSVLIVGGHQLHREGLRLQLEAEANFMVVGDAASAEEGLSEALRHEPDVVLIDVDMPGVSCFDVMRRIHEQLPHIKTVVLSGEKNDGQISRAIHAHAWGYAVKQEGFDKLRNAIEYVTTGKAYYAEGVLDRIQTGDGQPRPGERLWTRLDTLTPRERELLVLLGQGYSLKEASHALHVSYKTADKHKCNLMNKLNIHDRVELARFAIRENIVQA